MKYRKNEVMDIVASVLGYDCNGVYINSSSIYESQDQSIITHFSNNMDEIVFMDYEYDNVKINLGASKLVIIPNNTKYVIKIPFTTMYNEDCIECDDDVDSYCEGKGTNCGYLGCASCCYHCNRYTYSLGQDVQYDICADEQNIYEEASDELQQLLVPNIFIGMFNGVVPVYIQKKIKNTARTKKTNSVATAAEKKIACLVMDKNDCFLDAGAMAQYIVKFGICKFRELVQEITMLDDLHSGNWGYFEDGSVGIIDYGGYSEEGLWG